MRNIIEQQIASNPVVLYMKGTVRSPQCGFSSRVLSILLERDVTPFVVDVLADEDMRQAIKDFSNWPTFPQLYIKGKFIGGCDIVTEMHHSGELKRLLQEAARD